MTRSDHGMMLFGRFEAAATLVTASGFHVVSPWWLRTIRRFLISGCRQLVLRVGRRGGKSSTLCLLVVIVGAFGRFDIPLGDVGIVAIISVSRPEALGRLRTISALLDALGIEYRPNGDTIELVSRPIVFAVFTASTSGVVGGTVVFAFCDELCHWRDKDTQANPATKVLGQLRPTLATQPFAMMVLSSAPITLRDAHADAFDAGESDYQQVAHAPTWVANPSPETTEAETHRLEPDPEMWAMNFAAIPQEGTTEGLLAPGPVTATTRTILEVDPHECAGWTLVCAMDPATRGDAWTAIGLAFKGEKVRVLFVFRMRGNRIGPLVPTTVFTYLRPILRRYGINGVYSDQASLDAIADIGGRMGIPVWGRSWTATNKTSAFEHLKMLTNSRSLELSPDPVLRRDLLAVRKRMLPTGQTRIELPKTEDGHCDAASALALGILVGSGAETAARQRESIDRKFERFLDAQEDVAFNRAHGLPCRADARLEQEYQDYTRQQREQNARDVAEENIRLAALAAEYERTNNVSR